MKFCSGFPEYVFLLEIVVLDPFGGFSVYLCSLTWLSVFSANCFQQSTMLEVSCI
jgi:hypothetical protein